MDPSEDDRLAADMARRAAQSSGHRTQELLNERPVPPHKAQRELKAPIPVRVHLVWAQDGDEWVDAEAVGWCRRRGYKPVARVQLRREVRVRTVCVWVDADDVERL